MDETTLTDKENQESDKPPSIRPQPVRPWRVAVIANIKGETALPFDGPADAGAEFDRIETIQAIQAAIESDGHQTVILPADANLPYTLQDARPDICFNIAEGLGGDAREAQVPALLELLGIPYTASKVMTNAIALDKTMTKRIWRDHGLPIAEFQEFVTGNEPISPNLTFPLFVKPAREGTGMGMDGNAKVNNPTELRNRVRWVISEYKQPALVETYLPGREFTVAVMGREGYAPYSRKPELYGVDGFHRFPVLEIDSSHSVTPGIYGRVAKTVRDWEPGTPIYLCPAPIDKYLSDQLRSMAIRAHLAIGAIDVSRVDIRLDGDGNPCLLEINTLPGLTPEFSDLCVISRAEKLSYQDLILEILYLGASRYGMVQAAEPVELPLKMPSFAKTYHPVSRVMLRK